MSTEYVLGETDVDTAEYRPPAEGPRRLVWAAISAAALVLGGLAGFLSWQNASQRASGIAAVESLAAAREAATAILSYRTESVDRDLNAARERLTGTFLEEYTKLINEVVIPGSREKRISAIAQVPAAAAVSATPSHATALVFVNQTVNIGNDAPTDTASSVRVTLDKVGGRWLVSGFEPV
ncbi:MAG TPA: hypothetical protein DEP24_13505 [Mycobacterium sp.]|nr:hypothetical protein [Mycobacterium sp.]